jgi:hypothetical protein
MEYALDLYRAALLPLLHEVADLIGVREPDDRVHVVGHDDEADALAQLQGELGVEHSENDPLGSVVVEGSTATIAREGHETDASF